MQKLTLNIYNADGTVKCTHTANQIDIRFGTVRRLMKLLKINNANDSTELLALVSDCYDEITAILAEIFPDIDDKDWDYVKLKELLQVVMAVLGNSLKDLLSIPSDPKNIAGA